MPSYWSRYSSTSVLTERQFHLHQSTPSPVRDTQSHSQSLLFHPHHIYTQDSVSHLLHPWLPQSHRWQCPHGPICGLTPDVSSLPLRGLEGFAPEVGNWVPPEASPSPSPSTLSCAHFSLGFEMAHPISLRAALAYLEFRVRVSGARRVTLTVCVEVFWKQ